MLIQVTIVLTVFTKICKLIQVTIVLTILTKICILSQVTIVLMILTKICILIQVTAVLSVFLKICLLPVSDLSYSKFCLLIPKKKNCTQAASSTSIDHSSSLLLLGSYFECMVVNIFVDIEFVKCIKCV